MALATGYHLLGVGVAGFLFIASARVWGKRHLYLLGTILIIISSAWGGATGTDYKSFLWARIVQGVGLAPFEALVKSKSSNLALEILEYTDTNRSTPVLGISTLFMYVQYWSLSARVELPADL